MQAINDIRYACCILLPWIDRPFRPCIQPVKLEFAWGGVSWCFFLVLLRCCLLENLPCGECKEGTYLPLCWWILLQELKIDTDALNLSQTMIDVHFPLVGNCSLPIGRWFVGHFPNRGRWSLILYEIIDGGFLKWGYPQIIHLGFFHYKPAILGYFHFWKPMYIYISLSLSLCVWNVWIDVKLPTFLCCSFWLSNLAAGRLEPICLSSPTKLWHFGGWVVWSTTCTCIFTSYGMGLSREPLPAILYGCRNLMVNFLPGYLDRYLGTSVQHSELRAWITIGNLWYGLWLHFVVDVFLHAYSDEYIFEDPFRSQFSLVLHEWDSVPDGSLCWSFPI